MKRILPAFLMLSFGLVAKTTATFEPCEKTYVTPEIVNLHLNAIHVDQEGENLQTSTLYSDENGLYFRDCLKEKQMVRIIDLDALFRESDLIVVTDDLIDPLLEVEKALDPLVLSDDLINEAPLLASQESPPTTGSPQPAAPTPSEPPPQPTRRANNWPFCDKQR